VNLSIDEGKYNQKEDASGKNLFGLLPLSEDFHANHLI
jgi:hypothetical protein